MALPGAAPSRPNARLIHADCVPVRRASPVADEWSGECNHGGSKLVPEHERSDDFEDAHDDEPDAEQDGENIQGGGRRTGDHCSSDDAYHPECDPPGPSFAGV